MDAPKKSRRSYLTAFAALAAAAALASTGWLAGTSKAAVPEKPPSAKSDIARSFTLKEWLLLAK